MRHLISTRLRLMYVLAALALAQVAWGASTTWPVPPSRLSLATPYGILHVKTSDYIYESTLQFQEKPVAPKITGILNITYAFSMPEAQAALISINQGSYQCPISYRWVLIKKNDITVSPAFGSCSKQIKVSATKRGLTLETPNRQQPNKIDVFTYNGKTIQHRIQP